jgi:bifunctional oligoribonuclease and PAP phosphatase NrnA
MDEEIAKFKELVESSGRILVISHISPDPDAVSSLLLMGATLTLNYPGKEILMVLEEEPLDLNFIFAYDQIHFEGLPKAIIDYKPDLLLLLDGNNFDRASRHEGEKVRSLIKHQNIKTAVIDHHELAGKEDVDLFINRHNPATAQTVYELLFKELRLDKPEKAAQTAMTGFYADTGGFLYLKDGQQSGMFDFMEELVASGADVETIKNQLSQYTEDDMQVIGELARNINHHQDYSYSFISDGFMDQWLKKNSQAQIQRGTGVFLDDFIRNIGGRKWGFIVYRNTLQGDNYYSVSLRSVNGIKDTSLIAGKLGGGGHKGASGAKVVAGTVKEAISKVKQTVDAEA